MAAVALRDALPDFGVRTRVPRTGPEPVVAVATVSDNQPEPRFAEPDPQLIEAAVEAARMALTERLNAEHEASLATLGQAHAAEVDEIRREAAAAFGPELAARLDLLESRLIDLTGAVTARIISGLVAPKMQVRATAELARMISEALADRDVQRIRVAGPASLREALIPALGTYADRAEFSDTQSVDVSVSLDETIYETRLGAWQDVLAQVLD